MRFGKGDIDDQYFQIVKREIEAFAKYVYEVIREHGYNLNTTNISFIEDIKENAKGYEQLARMVLRAG